MWYNFDPERFAEDMLPPILRRPLLLALLRAILKPLTGLMARFTSLRQQSRKRLAVTGQTISLVETLRERYRLPEGVIYITEASERQIYIFQAGEGRTNTYIHSTREQRDLTTIRFAEEGSREPDFTLHLPDFLASEEAEIRRFLDLYKPAGKRYAIELYPYA